MDCTMVVEGVVARWMTLVQSRVPVVVRDRDRVHDGTSVRRNWVSAIVQYYLDRQCRSTDPRRNFLGYQNIVADEAKAVTIVLNKFL